MPENKTGKEKKPRRRIKKVKSHGGHHGGAWKVAYADFVTAMMALFLVLWLVSQADTKLKKEIANYFRSPGAFTTTKGGILSGASKVSREPNKLTSKDEERALYKISQNLKQKFDSNAKSSKTKGKVKVEVTKEGLRIQILDKVDNVSFAVGNATLTEEARQILSEIAKAICELPNPIIIGGHTDSRVFPSETGYTNWELSADRANAARRALLAGCVKPEQIQRIIGYADTDPLLPDDPNAPANRRISITVLRTVFEDEGETGNANPEEMSSISPDLTKEVDEQIKKPVQIPKKTVKQTAKPEKEESESVPESDVKKENQEKRSDEKRSLEKKLIEDGQVSVGKPDKIPPNAKTRKTKTSKP